MDYKVSTIMFLICYKASTAMVRIRKYLHYEMLLNHKIQFLP